MTALDNQQQPLTSGDLHLSLVPGQEHNDQDPTRTAALLLSDTTPQNLTITGDGQQATQGRQANAGEAGATLVAPPADKVHENEIQGDVRTSWVGGCVTDCWGPQSKNSAGDARQLLRFNAHDLSTEKQFWALQQNADAAKGKHSNGVPTAHSEAHLVRADSPNGSIVTDGNGPNHGRVIDASKDNSRVYQRSSDGLQKVVRNDGMTAAYDSRSKTADITLPGNKAVSVHNTPDGSWKDLNGTKVFTATKSSTEFDKNTMQSDKAYMFTDGVAMVKHDNATYIYSKGGQEEVRTRAGKFVVDGDNITFYNKQHKDGVQVTNNNARQIQSEMARDGVTKPVVQVGDNGKPKLEHVQPQGMKIDNSGHDAVKVTIPDATSSHDAAVATLGNGQVTLDVPNQYHFVDTANGEQAYSLQDGSVGSPLYNYDYSASLAGNFYTPDVTFNADGTTQLNWDGTDVGSDGSVYTGDGYSAYTALQSDDSGDGSSGYTSDGSSGYGGDGTTDGSTGYTDPSAIVAVNGDTAAAVDLTANLSGDLPYSDVATDVAKVDLSRVEAQDALEQVLASGNPRALDALGDLQDDLSKLDQTEDLAKSELEQTEHRRKAGVAGTALGVNSSGQVLAQQTKGRSDNEDDDWMTA